MVEPPSVHQAGHVRAPLWGGDATSAAAQVCFSGTTTLL